MREVRVTQDPVTGVWRFRLCGHDVEVEPLHGFVKIDGHLSHVPAVEGLRSLDDLPGAPLDAITRLLPASAAPPHAPNPSTEQSPVPPPRSQRAPKDKLPSRAQRSPKAKPRGQKQVQPHIPAQTTAPEAPVLATHDAAAYVGLSPATLATLRSRGGGPRFVKLGSRVVYRRADLEAWLAARMRRSTSDPGAQN